MGMSLEMLEQYGTEILIGPAGHYYAQNGGDLKLLAYMNRDKMDRGYTGDHEFQ